MRRIALCWFTLALLLASCNTMQGLGKDIETLGDKIEKKAKN